MSEELYAIETDLMLEGIRRFYGYDLSGYAPAALKRGIARALAQEGLRSVSAFQDKVLREPECMERFLSTLTIRASSLFREPEFFKAFRSKVAPVLRTYPFVRVWIAGCASGEEVFATAILLLECGVYDRCTVYATELSETVLRRAQEGLYPAASLSEFRDNYRRSGGEAELSQYFVQRSDRIAFRTELLENVTFAQHNLASDASFNEFNVILCRNMMPYCQKNLQERAHRLFYESLCRLGVLGLGQNDSLEEISTMACFESSGAPGLYRKIR